MTSSNPQPRPLFSPRQVRLEASTACQLRCPSCPTASGATGRSLGSGFLKLADFQAFARDNPNVAHIELSNWGEVFLNKELVSIFQHAYRHNVCLYIANGANLNHISHETIEALVRYRVRKITCSIDGASQETYARYRVRGGFDRVIDNIKAINKAKARRRSKYPQLVWQFVVFGHNEHEIARAREMANSLGMGFVLKLSWEDLYGLPNPSPVIDHNLVGKETGLGVASRREYLARYGQDYVERGCCRSLWTAPQINYDGRVLGCPINYWADFSNAFAEGLDRVMNGQAMHQARAMLMGKIEPVEGLPCTACKVYHAMRRDQAWITDEDVRPERRSRRRYIMLEKILGEVGAHWLVTARNRIRAACRSLGDAASHRKLDLRSVVDSLMSSGSGPLIPNQGYSLSLPLALDSAEQWQPHPLFDGHTSGIDEFLCHVSALAPGHCPHPPHGHRHDEILIMLHGEAELHLPHHNGPDGGNRMILKAGEFVYYPSQFPHTLTTTSAVPANYLMFKWATRMDTPPAGRLPFGKYSFAGSLALDAGKTGFTAHNVYEGPGTWLKRMHCHTSVLAPGARYAPHRDSHAVAIVILAGEVETLGQRFRPHSVIFHPAGSRHGMSNPGVLPARYIVFEFQFRQ